MKNKPARCLLSNLFLEKHRVSAISTLSTISLSPHMPCTNSPVQRTPGSYQALTKHKAGSNPAAPAVLIAPTHASHPSDPHPYTLLSCILHHNLLVPTRHTYSHRHLAGHAWIASFACVKTQRARGILPAHQHLRELA